jgi:acyl-CoA reductase-like NAD-dependent aldehyde dehydrogenase
MSATVGVHQPRSFLDGEYAKARGGFKHSVTGKELSLYGLDKYTWVKHVMANIAS